MSVNRVLIVGSGSIGTLHLRLAREILPHADIRVLRREEGGPSPQHANGTFFRIDQAIDFAPQIAVIANPAPFHLSTAELMVDAGVHLLVEKPLSVSAEGGGRLVASCRQRGVVLLTGYNLRFLPSLQRFHDLIEQNVLGKVFSVRCEIGQYLPSWRPETDYRNGVTARRELGGGALLELSHELDYLRWIFGDISWVQASLSKQSQLEIDVEDTAHLILGFQHKPGDQPLIGTLNMDVVRHDTTRLCTAIGELGSLRWNGLTGTVELLESGGKGWSEIYRYQHKREDSYRSEWQNFLACINKESVPLVDGFDGLKVMQVIDAVRKSSEMGARVSLLNDQSIGRENV